MTVGALLRLPLWGMMWLALPKRRAKLAAKMRLRLWLIVRHSPPPRTQSIQNLEPGT
jgi:hypothetical protein